MPARRSCSSRFEFGITPTRAWQVVDRARKRAVAAEDVARPLPPMVVSPAVKPTLTRAQLLVRARTMARLWLEGVSLAALGRRFMLSRERVRQIVKRRLARQE